MKRVFILLVVFCLPLGAWSSEQKLQKTSLFNGEDLSGWHEIGGGKWSVQNGEIIGETGDGRYGWLVTNKPYSNFVLELKFKAEGKGNSGIQFRSHVIDGHMKGYQAELDPTIGKHTGGVYDEATGRGWLAQPTEEQEKILKPDEWNHYRIKAVGHHIQTFLNGENIVDFEDDRAIRGIIALQVHSGKTPPVKIRWKDIAIYDLGYGKGWKPLFNGKNLDGWVEHGKEKWYVEDGLLIGQAVTDEYGYLSTEAQYKDFVARVKFNATGTGNSGLFFHSSFKGVRVYGVQAEIDPNPNRHTGGLYESGGRGSEGTRGWLVQPNEDAEKVLNPFGEWNELLLWVKGNHFVTYVNGLKAVDYVDENQYFKKGSLALQLHSGGSSGLKFKDLYVKELK